MTDDGSIKGPGGKPGRKSTVVSMSAHKSRHSAESDPSSKKLSSLTLFDFEPSEACPADSSMRQPSGVSLASSAALPCENTPFERDLALGESTSRESGRAPGRKFLRWGLEDGGPSEHDVLDRRTFEDEGSDGGQEKISSNFLDKDTDLSQLSRGSRHRWQHKSSRSLSVVESFYHAIHGLRAGFASQRNVRIHCAIAVVVFALALIFKVDALGCLALSLATGFVLFAEYVNTALEHVTDIQANYRYHQSARLAKDTAAGAVLIAALTAVLVGAIVFVPHFLALLSGAQP
jgi:diacylglycerol kinase (ATP)